MYSLISKPLTVQWEVTYDCNKNCVHCYNYWRDKDTILSQKSSFNHDNAQRIVDEIIRCEVPNVVITGGEPLLVINDVYRYIEQFNNAGIRVTLNSNLMAMTDDIAKKLFSLGIKTILSSFPAHSPELDQKITNSKYSFDKTCEGIRICAANGISVTANMVVTKLNYDYIYETAKIAKECGAKRFSINRAMQPSNCETFDEYRISIEEFRKIPYILKQIKDELDINVSSVEANPLCFIEDEALISETGCNRVCGAGRTFCTIDPTGQIRPCGLFNDNYGTNLEEAWKAMISFRNDDFLPEKCQNCGKKDKCGGGCKAERKYANGDIKSVDSFANLDYIRPVNNTKPKCFVTDENEFVFSNNIFSRKENDGTYLMKSPKGSIIIVDEKTYNFFINNRTSLFMAKDYAACMNVTANDMLETIQYLVYKGFVKVAS